MKRFIKRIKILNYIYRLCLIDPPNIMGVEHHLGECDPPETPNKEIRICTSAKGLEELDTLIHEMLHALAYHQFSEEFVCQSATHIAKVLWDWGYRKVPEEGIVWKQEQKAETKRLEEEAALQQRLKEMEEQRRNNDSPSS